MTRHHGKDRNIATAPRSPEPGPNHQAPAPDTVSEPAPGTPTPPPGTGSVSWWLVLLVWVLAAAVLWGSEMIRLVYRMFNATPPA